MRILSIHNNYILAGGEDVSTDTEIKILRDKGHEVTAYKENNSKINEIPKSSVALRTVWSKESYSNVERILKEKKYDIVHVQNFLPLISPSVYYAAKSQNVPIVQAVRNYRFLCNNSLLFRDGKVCELCVGKTIPFPGIVHTCYRNVGANLAVSAMLTVHNVIKSWDKVDMFACISEFVKNKMIQGGFPEKKLYVKPNFVYPDPDQNIEKENYLLFVGRLTDDKGIFTLLDAIKLLENKTIKVKIVGEGPLLDVLKNNTDNSNVEFLGKRSIEETYTLIGNARVLVIPSLWNEPFGRVVIEAYAKGTPVIGAKAGGIPELIIDGVTGVVFEPGDHNDLRDKIQFMFSDLDRTASMGRNAREEYLRTYTAERNYDMLMDIYNQVL